MTSSDVFRVFGLIGLFAVMVLGLTACGDSASSGSGGTTAPPGTGGTGAIGGGFGGCAPCVDTGAELAENGCDDNCNLLVDEVVTCDASLEIDSTNPVNGARAMDVCEGAVNDTDWGVVSVSYLRPAGETPPNAQQAAYDLGHGRLNAFGPIIARAGLSFLALSSGTARDVDDPGYQSRDGFDKGYTSNLPTGFPVDVPACGALPPTTPSDGIALSIDFRAPPNATGFAFDHAFFTADFPNLTCSAFSDVFAVIMDPAPSGVPAGNLPRDDDGNPIGIDSAFIDACGCDDGPPCEAGARSYACSLGTDLLAGTGYEQGASTGWLTTRVPVAAGSEFEVRFAIWDSGDGVLDSTVLIDNFRWLDYRGEVLTTPVTP